MRGIAAILIMSKHALYEVSQISPVDINYETFRYFSVGIDMFFVLSGFIMIYISREQQGFTAAREFLVRRFLRIVPTYWFYTFVLLGVAMIMPQVLGTAEFVPLHFLKSLFFITYENTAGDLQPFLANGWTLNYEIYFYVIFALCMILPVKFGLPVMALYFISSVATDFYGLGGINDQFYARPIVLEFLAGSIIGWLFIKNIRLPSWCFWVGVVYTVGAIITLLFPDTFKMITGLDYSRMFVATICIALLVLPKGAEYVPAPKWGIRLGDASYTIYLSHPFAIGAITQAVLLMGWQNTLSPWIIFWTIFVVAIIGGLIAYQIIEKPLLSWGKKLLYKGENKKSLAA
jgi:exopolysaccharide production protein ExoZ